MDPTQMPNRAPKRRRLYEAEHNHFLGHEPHPVAFEEHRLNASPLGNELSEIPRPKTKDATDNIAPTTSPVEQEDYKRMCAEKVCFGVVPSISAKCDWKSSHIPSPPFSVQLESSTHFTAEDYPDTSGMIFSGHGDMIQGLLAEKSLDLYVLCVVNDFQNIASGKTPQNSVTVKCTLEITIYGPCDIFEDIGSWFNEHKVFLQDPRTCHLNVKYYNPHRLSSDKIGSCPLVSEVVERGIETLELENRTRQDDLNDILSNHEHLEETPQPTVIRTALKMHQKKALTFMLRRERGWAFNRQRSDVCQRVNTEHEQFSVNRTSDPHHSTEPPQCHGGIIADPMGMGKTLSMIALVATNPNAYSVYTDHVKTEHVAVLATLIVVPPAVLAAWEEELSLHVIDQSVKYRRHYRETRLNSIDELEMCDIVLTTYHTLALEWNRGESGVSVPFSVRWRRVILDEGRAIWTHHGPLWDLLTNAAHCIRKGSTKICQAVCALDSDFRWAVTGTPMSNRLGDLETLFKFIRAYPHTDRISFDADVSRLRTSEEYAERIKRLKRLSSCLLLRRPKSVISLPPRQDMRCPVDFSPEERTLYHTLRQQALTSIGEALKLDKDASETGIRANIMNQIESLRLVCSLGLYYRTRHDKTLHGSKNDDNWATIAQATFNFQQQLGPVVCSQCSSTLEITESLLDDPTIAQQSAQFHSCLTFVCADCTQNIAQTGRRVECGHRPRCPLAPVSTNVHALESTLDEMQSQEETSHINLPSKVEALITDIKTLPQDDKCIVFSARRLTLDVLETGLNQASIRSLRFDGKVPQRERQQILDRFSADPSIRVVLLTLFCGAAGLSLTAATRAYLMEPHWNPTLEEQALARIHRIGQTRKVTTVRFHVRDSLEEYVMDVRDSKKHLAGVLLPPRDGGQEDESLGRLEILRSII